MCAPQMIEKLLSCQARRKSKVMQVAVAHVRAVSLNSQRHEAVFAYRPTFVCFGLVQTWTLEFFPRTRGAGDDGDGTLPRVRLTFLSSPACGVAATEGMSLSRAGLVILSVPRGGGDLTGVRTVFMVAILALIVTVLLAVTEICGRMSRMLRYC